jgi:N-acetylglucosaminyldiphosphoundecaprenol N-acetyl-beta-D-mannosaminyltransferase
MTAGSARHPRATVLGCEIDALDMEQTLYRCEELIQTRGFAQHVAINAAKLVAMRDDADLRAIVAACELVNADGQAIVWASRILGDPLPERVAGVDLMERLFERSAAKGYRVYILGARAEVLEQAVARFRERYPALVLAGYRDGYFSDDESAAVAEEVRSARPDILFVAISSPRKEYWLGRYGRDLGVPFVMGVGGSIDVAAGLTRRAPAALQRLGLEWLFRLLQEPRRLIRRYAETNARFLLLVAHELWRRRVRPGAARH